MTEPAKPATCGCRVDRWLFLFATVLAVTLDLWSKSAVFAWVVAQPGEAFDKRVVLVPGWFEFVERYNDAGVWSIGRGMANSNAIIAAVGVLMVGLIVWWAKHAFRPTDRLVPTLAGFILGGAIGNLHDRMFFPGVRDFIQVYLWGWPYPTFNVADSFVVTSAILLMVTMFVADFIAVKPTSDAKASVPNGTPEPV